jgi:hypothetical protein
MQARQELRQYQLLLIRIGLVAGAALLLGIGLAGVILGLLRHAREERGARALLVLGLCSLLLFFLGSGGGLLMYLGLQAQWQPRPASELARMDQARRRPVIAQLGPAPRATAEKAETKARRAGKALADGAPAKAAPEGKFGAPPKNAPEVRDQGSGNVSQAKNKDNDPGKGAKPQMRVEKKKDAAPGGGAGPKSAIMAPAPPGAVVPPSPAAPTPPPGAAPAPPAIPGLSGAAMSAKIEGAAGGVQLGDASLPQPPGPGGGPKAGRGQPNKALALPKTARDDELTPDALRKQGNLRLLAKRQLARPDEIAGLPGAPIPFVVREYAHRYERKADDAPADFSETLYWHPALVTSDGTVEVAFDLSDAVTTFRVLVWGHDVAGGRLGEATTKIIVK